MTPEELVQEARNAVAAVGVSGDRPSDNEARGEYFHRLRSVAEGLVARASNDSALLQEAIMLALTEDATGGARYMSGATSALGLAAVWMIPPGTAALDAAVVAEGMTMGASKGLGARRVQAIANLTRWEPQALAEAVRLVPTGIVRLSEVPDGVAIARDILIAAQEVLESMGPGKDNG